MSGPRQTLAFSAACKSLSQTLTFLAGGAGLDSCGPFRQVLWRKVSVMCTLR